MMEAGEEDTHKAQPNFASTYKRRYRHENTIMHNHECLRIASFLSKFHFILLPLPCRVDSEPRLDMFKCQASVSVEIKKEDYSTIGSSDEEWLIKALSDFLKDKRYYSNLWSIEAWKTIKCALVENSGNTKC